MNRQVLALEPSNPRALAGLAVSLAGAVIHGWIPDPVVREKHLEEARDLALKAKELDPSISNIYVALAILAGERGDLEGARRADETALLLNPKSPLSHNNLAITYIDAGEGERAIELLVEAIRLDPRHPRDFILGNMGHAQFMVGDIDAAVEWLQKAVDPNPGSARSHAFLAMAYARKGDHAGLQDAVAALLRVDPNFSLSKFETPKPGCPAAYREFWETKLLVAGRLAGLPE